MTHMEPTTSSSIPLTEVAGLDLPISWPRRLVSSLRVRLSNYLFWGVVIVEVVCGWRPLDVDNLYRKEVVVGIFLVFAGLFLRSWAAGVIRKSAAFACSGPYLLTSHPLYVGSLMMMLGFCTLIGHPLNFLVVLGPVWLTYAAAIEREERLLKLRFADEWEQYCAEGPMSRLWNCPERLLADWSPATWWKNREYRAVCGTLIGFAGVRYWYEMPDLWALFR